MEVQEGKYLTFLLEDENYGFPIMRIKEIIGLMDITPVPKTPSFIKGVINLRGKIIPVMDLRIKFNMSENIYNEKTCIIVVEIENKNAQSLVGIVVDTVAEVINFPKDDIEPPPQYGSDIENSFLTGVGKLKDKVIMLLNIDKIVNIEEMATLLR